MKDKKILYGIIIAFIFLLSIGLTYAYFSVTTNVVGDRNDIRANAGVLSILYTDGPEIVGNNINPGWTETKVVKVKNTGTLKAYYTLLWDSLTNEITNDELMVSATCSSDIATCDDLESTPVGADELAIGVGIEPGEEQTYTLTFEFIEISSAQNYNQGKAFNGVLRVEDSLQTFALTGMLLDSNGDPIENAVIEVHSKVRTGITDENGIFGISGVEVGSHELIVKNLSNEVIATDSITLTGGQSETISNKDIVADTNSPAINMTVKLGETTNIDTISTWSYEELCAINADSLGCKILSSGVRLITNLDGGSLVQSIGEEFNKNSSIVLGCPYKSNYAFIGWTLMSKDALLDGDILKFGNNSASITANYIAYSEMYEYTGTSQISDDGIGNWKIKFLTSGIFTPHFNMLIDAFLVGGGGGGKTMANQAVGAGSGYTKTSNFIGLVAETPYSIEIGLGGAAVSGATGLTGGTTSAFEKTALGGVGGGESVGGNGGSGGGDNFSAGGTDGSNGIGSNGVFGVGQGTTTREFAEPTGTLYAKGGNGGMYSAPAGSEGGSGRGVPGIANTGGGGSSNYWGNGGAGGSGIVVIRRAKSTCIGETKIFCFSYTGTYNLENQTTDNWKIKFLSSGILIAASQLNIDVFLVGGGGGGGSGAGGGGGGGYTTTQLGISPIKYSSYTITIGAGGAKGTSDGAGANGGTTTAFSYSALGGYGGSGWSSTTKCKGGNGGSGGSGGTNAGTAGAGGNDGNNGAAGVTGTFGIGQGTTTREFADPTGTLYGSGGGGGNNGVGSNGAGSGGNYGIGNNATVNTGGGGGGSGSGSSYAGGIGGSGIVIIRASN